MLFLTVINVTESLLQSLPSLQVVFIVNDKKAKHNEFGNDEELATLRYLNA